MREWLIGLSLAFAAAVAAQTNEAGAVVNGEIRVTLAPGTTVAQARAFADANGLEFVRAMRVPNSFLLRVKQAAMPNASQLAAEKAADLAKLPGVRNPEPNWKYFRHEQTPNDPLYSQQWNLKQMNVHLTWDFQKGKDGIVVCVLDTSVDISHPDFQLGGGQSRLLPGYNADDDSDDPSPGPNWPDSHGTMVASVIAAATNNAIGMAGVCWEGIKILPIRATDNPWFFSAALYEESLQWVVDYNNSRTPKVAVLNLSLGSYNQSAREEELINQIFNQGTLIVASSGNDRPVLAGWPASYKNVISIGATARGGAIASYSNPGSTDRSRKVDFAAPAGDGYGPSEATTVMDMRGIYTTAVGTSFSAPMASGAIAMLLSQGVAPTDVFDVLRSSANTHNLSVPNPDYGYGEIDLFEALRRFGGSVQFLTPAANEVFEYTNIRVRIRLGNVVPESVVVRDGTTVIPHGTITPIDSVFSEIDFTRAFSSGSHTLSVTATSAINGNPISPVPTRTFRVQPRVQPAGTAMFAVPYGVGTARPEQLIAGTFRLQRFVYQDRNGNPVPDGEWARYTQSDTSDARASFSPPDADVTKVGVSGDFRPFGVGYFLTIPLATPLPVQNPPDTDNSYSIGLKPGWQMFGNPFPFVVDWNTVEVQSVNKRMSLQEAIADEFIRPQIYRWSPTELAYTWRAAPQGQLYPWEGAWVYCRKDCKLIVHPLPTSSRAPGDDRPAIRGDGWALRLAATAGGMRDARNYIGVTSDPDAAFDAVPKAPAPIESVRLTLLGDDGRTPYAQLLKPASTRNMEWTLSVVAPNVDGDVTLEWEEIVRSSSGVSYTLVDTVSGRRVSMNHTSSYSFRPDGDGTPRLFKVVATPASAAKLMVTGLGVTSSKGRGSVSYTVVYSLNREAHVSVSILSQTGKQVAVLSSGSRAAGANQAVWNGRDQAGISVPPGVYLAQVTATGSNGEQVRVVSPVVLTR
ncbi:MAG: S8 family serine peptidase [Fimbriimonadia bacterium]|jgi:hypothetical protein